MVSVDDLVISLRIDDTSNLGKLQKQLTALVGPKGEKAGVLGLGISPALKKDLDEIKNRLVRLTPTVLVEGNLKEAAFNLASDLKKDKSLREALLERYDISTDKFDTFVEELFNITLGLSELNSDQKKSFITEMDKFRKIADMARGDRKTLITKLTRLLQEVTFHKKTVEAFRAAGLRIVSKPSVYEVTKKQLKESGIDWKEIIEGYSIKYGKTFDEIKTIFDENSDTLEATSEAVEEATGEVFDITNLTASQIEKNDKLMMVLVAQVASSLERTQWILGEFYEAGKVMFTGGRKYRSGMAWLDTVVHRFTPEALRQLGLEKVTGEDIDTNMRNLLTEYKAVATLSNIRDEANKRLIQQGYNNLIFVVEESSKEAKDKIDELRQMEEYKGKGISLYKYTPRQAQKTLGIEKPLDDLKDQAQLVIDKMDEVVEETEAQKEFMNEDMLKFLEATEDFIKPEEITDEMKKAGYETNDKISDLVDGFEEIKEIVEDTNKEVKKEDLNEPKKEKDPTGDND